MLRIQGWAIAIVIITLYWAVTAAPPIVHGRELGSPQQSVLRPDSTPVFDTLGRESGISNLSVSSVIQDRYGFLWFGTQGGLNYYDGRTMETIRHNPYDQDGLVHNLIQTMYYDKDSHELWIGTYQGISRLCIHSGQFTNYAAEEGLSNPVVIAICKGPDGLIWAGTMDGLNRIHPDSGEITAYPVPGNVVRALHVDSQERLYVGTYEGLYQWDADTLSLQPAPWELPSAAVMAIAEFSENQLTLGLWEGGVLVIDAESGKTEHHVYDDNRVYTVFQTSDGTRWVGTWGGGLFADVPGGERHHFAGEGQEKSLSHPVVYSILEDHTGNLWVGTNGGGLNKANPRRSNFVRFSHDPGDPQSLSAGKINAIHRDIQGELWIAVYNRGLDRYDSEADTMIKYRTEGDYDHPLPTDNVVALHSDRDGRLLAGGSGGLFVYNREEDAFEPWRLLPADVIVYALAEQGPYLWIGTYNHGAFRYHREKQELEQFSQAGPDLRLSNNLVYDILVDSRDRVWIATNNGLNRLDPDGGSVQVYERQGTDAEQLAANTIRTAYEDSQGRIWFGLVGGGLARYIEDSHSFATFLEEDGLTSNVVTAVLEDDQGRIWAATHNGIAVLNPETEDFFSLTPQDGIGGWEFNAGNYKDHDGTLLFGGIHGIAAIPGQLSDTALEPPRVFVTGIDLYREPLESDRFFFNGQHLQFGPEDRFLHFQFAALDYDSPDKTRFQYRLEGFDQDWIRAGSRNYATYSNLPPGEYRLLVSAESLRSVPSEPIDVSFSIAAPWYRTVPAYAGYFLLFCGFAAGLVKIREGQLVQKRNAELARLNQQLAEANSQLEHLSTSDPLTGLSNRRHFDRVFDAQLELARRSQLPMALLMLDIDEFKGINDRCGHVTGDQVLKEIAAALSESLPRSTDFAARLGGDEFAVVLYDTAQKGARLVAERIMNKLKGIRPAADCPPVSVSIGVVAAIPDEDTDLDSMLRSADSAMYKSKTERMNGITVYAPENSTKGR